VRAAIYEAQGPASEVLQVVTLDPPQPAAGEVRVRVAFSGVNPSDVGARSGRSPRSRFGRVIPHSDGAGVIDAVGAGVPHDRIGQRVWLYNAQWERAFGTAAEYVTLPSHLAVPLPAQVSLEMGATLGIPLMTAFHAIASCGSIMGSTVLVFGAAGCVGFYATQLATLGGARVIAVVSSAQKARIATAAGAHAVVNYRSEDVPARVREITAGEGAHCIIDVDGARNAKMYADLLRFNGKVVVYGSTAAEMTLAFRPLIRAFATICFFIVYKLPDDVARDTIAGITRLLEQDRIRAPRTIVHPLEDIARAHEEVERGADGKVLVKIERQLERT
jgi:NADPH2:quinone reductase